MGIRNTGSLADLTMEVPPKRIPGAPEKSPLMLTLKDVAERYASSKRQRFYYIERNPDGTRKFGIVERTPVFDVPEELYVRLGMPGADDDISAKAFAEAYKRFMRSQG